MHNNAVPRLLNLSRCRVKWILLSGTCTKSKMKSNRAHGVTLLEPFEEGQARKGWRLQRDGFGLGEKPRGLLSCQTLHEHVPKITIVKGTP